MNGKDIGIELSRLRNDCKSQQRKQFDASAGRPFLLAGYFQYPALRIPLLIVILSIVVVFVGSDYERSNRIPRLRSGIESHLPAGTSRAKVLEYLVATRAEHGISDTGQRDLWAMYRNVDAWPWGGVVLTSLRVHFTFDANDHLRGKTFEKLYTGF